LADAVCMPEKGMNANWERGVKKSKMPKRTGKLLQPSQVIDSTLIWYSTYGQPIDRYLMRKAF